MVSLNEFDAPVTAAVMARILGVKSAWLITEAKAGRLPHIPAGQTVLFNIDIVKRCLFERSKELPCRAQA
ncbi:MAG: hypothetical protein HY287_00605 [Planctomycetes bacterium]|nr:hypothetical protein [Planctomycetota bacterium]